MVLLNPQGVLLVMIVFGGSMALVGFLWAYYNWINIKGNIYSKFLPSDSIGTWAPLMNAVVFFIVGYIIGTLLVGQPTFARIDLTRFHRIGEAAAGEPGSAYFADTFESLLPADYYAAPEHIDFPNNPSLP